jgi:tRNA-splicing ligase RtcB
MIQRSAYAWEIPASAKMRVPGVIYGSRELIAGMDDKVRVQTENVATLPGIVKASYAMPDAHWGYGFPIGGVAAFDPGQGGVVSAGGVGFDISCGVRTLHTGLRTAAVTDVRRELAAALFAKIPAGVGSRGEIHLDPAEMDAMLLGGARWAVERGLGTEQDLERIEEHGRMEGADPEAVSEFAKRRQRDEMGTLGSGNHYLEVQRVAEVFDLETARAFGVHYDDIVLSIHCGSRGLGHQIGTEFLKEMVLAAPGHGLVLPDRELACAPIRSELGLRYLGAMRAAINCALANRQIITHLARLAVAEVLPQARLDLLYDVSHNTCKLEEHTVDGRMRPLFVHRKGATRAFGPGHPALPPVFRETGQPVLIGGTMGTASYIQAGTAEAEALSFGSSCHGAGRQMSRHQATKIWRGREVVDALAERGIIVLSPSPRGVAEEAPGAYKDVTQVAEAADHAGLSRRVARLEPIVCVKG